MNFNISESRYFHCSFQVQWRLKKINSDETKHRQTPNQTHHTKSEMTNLVLPAEGKDLDTTLCTGYTQDTVPGSSTCLQPCPAKCCWIAGFCPRGSSCHRNLPSTSQANSLLPTELHSWTIIINFWSSVTNVLKMCLRRKLSDTTKKLLPETRFGLSCLHSSFALGYIKWFQPQHRTPVWASGDAFTKIRHVGSINNILKHWPAQLPLHTIGLCLEPGTAWGQSEHSSRGSLTSRYFDLQNIRVVPDFNAPIASMN